LSYVIDKINLSYARLKANKTKKNYVPMCLILFKHIGT